MESASCDFPVLYISPFSMRSLGPPMMTKDAQLDLSYYYDENLQEVLVAPNDVQKYIAKKIILAKTTQDPETQVHHLGEAGVYLRMLRRLDSAEEILNEALSIAVAAQLPQSVQIAQEIRRAHVVQWKQNFAQSNDLFAQLIEKSSRLEPQDALIDFIWQHAGKNFFDQGAFREAVLAFKNALRLRKTREAPEDQIKSSEDSLSAATKHFNSKPN